MSRKLWSLFHLPVSKQYGFKRVKTAKKKLLVERSRYKETDGELQGADFEKESALNRAPGQQHLWSSERSSWESIESHILETKRKQSKETQQNILFVYELNLN